MMTEQMVVGKVIVIIWVSTTRLLIDVGLKKYFSNHNLFYIILTFNKR